MDRRGVAALCSSDAALSAGWPLSRLLRALSDRHAFSLDGQTCLRIGHGLAQCFSFNYYLSSSPVVWALAQWQELDLFGEWEGIDEAAVLLLSRASRRPPAAALDLVAEGRVALV